MHALTHPLFKANTRINRNNAKEGREAEAEGRLNMVSSEGGFQSPHHSPALTDGFVHSLR